MFMLEMMKHVQNSFSDHTHSACINAVIIIINTEQALACALHCACESAGGGGCVLWGSACMNKYLRFLNKYLFFILLVCNVR